MKFFIDSAAISEIKDALALGLCDGVTTNPSLVAKTGRPFESVIRDILEAVPGPVSLEVTALDYDGMMREAKRLSAYGDQVVVKLPLTKDGLKACKSCFDAGIATNVTLCFSPTQALIAAKAGATYISPFVGRLDDVSNDGMTLVEDILTIYRNYEYETQVLAASLRHPMHVAQAALAGAHVGTMPIGVLQQLFNHPLTDIGLAKFLEDWKKVPAS
ncbi:MAG: fructose-6-phosphate aldolase [Deltaproteobacteria bacterium]|nr:fructose-6-phosphate aldolase [Deltaproteobacteria bacterium]